MGFGRLVTVGGAVYALYGVALPWAQVTLFGALPVSLPGFLFIFGGVALTGALCAVLLYRYPLAVILCAIVILWALAQARTQIPHVVRGQLIGSQVAFGPLNRLLDQFHIQNVIVGTYGAKDEAFLGAGLAKTLAGGWLVLCGGIAALPGDPLLRWSYLALGYRKCRACGARCSLRRDARYCPHCGTSTETGVGRCPACGEPSEPKDRFCVRCGRGTIIHRNSYEVHTND